MIIIKAEVNNFKRLKALYFEPKAKGLTTLGGKNRQGKTSAINAIQMGFSGGKYKPSKIHNTTGGPGELAEAKFETDNGYKVRIFGRNGTIEVIDPNGVKGGITLFGDAVSSFAIDLRPFLNANAQEKYKIIVQAMGIEDLLEKIEAEREVAYDARTVANGMAAKAKAVFAQTPEPGTDVEIPDEVDVVKVSKEIQDINRANNGISQQASAREQTLEALKEAKDDVADLEQSLVTANQVMGELQASVDSWAALPDFFDGSDLQAKLEASKETNKTRTDLLKVQEDYDKALQANKDAQQQAKDAQKALDTVLTKKHNAVTELGELPDPDLALEKGKLLYKGQEWDCISGAEEYVVATKIGQATNKDCDFVLVDGLERMDEEQLAKYDAWGREAGVQQIGTIVTGDPEECSVYIEDGRV